MKRRLNHPLAPWLVVTAVVGTANVTAILLLTTDASSAAISAIWGWLFAMVSALMGYRVGCRRHHVIGELISYCSDEDGIPSHPPVTRTISVTERGLVLDHPHDESGDEHHPPRFRASRQPTSRELRGHRVDDEQT